MFQEKTLFDKKLARYINRFDDAEFTVVKVTDNPDIDILEYLLPQLNRVKYEDNLLQAISSKTIKLKRVERVVDWFCLTFKQEYSAKIDYTSDEYIVLYVYCESELFEIYGFKSKKEPEYRIIV